MAGIVDVGADTPQSSFTYQALTFARERAIASRTGDIQVPADLADPERVRRGAGNYAAMCVNCHLSPEAPDSEIRKGLYPTPPNLSEKPTSPPSRDAARDFWIIKHGIKASGMPAWGKSMSDPYIWGMVAFLERLPQLDAAQYRALVAQSEGHQHGGGEPDMHDHSSQHSGHDAPAESPHHPVADEPDTTVQRNVHQHADGSQHLH